MTEIQTPPEGTDDQAAIEPEQIDSTEPETPETPPSVEPEQPTPEPEPQAPDPYEQKFKESAREAQIIRERNKDLEAQISVLTNNLPPTEEEIRREFPEWDKLDDYNKRIVRRQVASEKTAKATQKAMLEMVAERRWNEDYAKAVKSNPKLLGREDEFKAYAKKPTHRNAPLDVLVRSFLYELPASTQPATPAAPQDARPARPGLESGSGGPKGPPQTNKIGLEEARRIRETDNKRYMQLLKAGMIDDDV
jgi:hypothetical protein